MAAAGYTGTAEQAAQLKKADSNVMFTTLSVDLPGSFDQVNGNLGCRSNGDPASSTTTLDAAMP